MILKISGYSHGIDEDPDIFYIEVDSIKAVYLIDIERNPSKDLQIMLKQYHKKFPIVTWSKEDWDKIPIQEKPIVKLLGEPKFDWTGLWITDQGRYVEMTTEGAWFIDKEKGSRLYGTLQIDNQGRVHGWGDLLIKRKRGDEAGWPKLKKENK